MNQPNQIVDQDEPKLDFFEYSDEETIPIRHNAEHQHLLGTGHFNMEDSPRPNCTQEQNNLDTPI